MSRCHIFALGVLALAPSLLLCEERKSPERRLRQLEARVKGLPEAPAADQTAVFLARESRRLLDRSRALPPASYEFDRITDALDDLLEAREQLTKAREETGAISRERDQDPQGRTARRLERTYFRVQQAEYFAALTRDEEAPVYVARIRQLYQEARAAYDRSAYVQSQRLADVSSELVEVLEKLAQAAVRRRDPPRLD